ncbi:hypothetical protein RQP46_000165 [Phenoliferia psychrophenolica]
MDWASSIQSDIASKKRAIEALSTEASSSKYMKRSELDRIRRAELSSNSSPSSKSPSPAPGSPAPSSPAPTSDQPSRALTPAAVATPPTEAADTIFQVTNAEAVRRLRLKGQPILLFGETDKERRLRLRALELIEERTDGGRNEFARALERVGEGVEKEKEKKKEKEATVVVAPPTDAAKGGKAEKKPKDEDVIVDVSLVKTDPHKVYPQIYFALKRVLKEWEQSLEDRPDAVKRSTQGKIAAATQQTSADYLKPLFKSLRKRDLAADVLQAIAEITYNMQVREYLVANDAYLRLSIGNAPWPIGVTMVGIHERSGREKIFSNNVAHVLNDETSRKYIQSIKRLLTFAQTIRPPDDLSQKCVPSTRSCVTFHR